MHNVILIKDICNQFFIISNFLRFLLLLRFAFYFCFSLSRIRFYYVNWRSESRADSTRSPTHPACLNVGVAIRFAVNFQLNVTRKTNDKMKIRSVLRMSSYATFSWRVCHSKHCVKFIFCGVFFLLEFFFIRFIPSGACCFSIRLLCS